MSQLYDLLWKEIKRKLVSLRAGQKFVSSKVNSNKRAALCYLGEVKVENHTNVQQQHEMVSVLEGLGFSVDLYNNCQSVGGNGVVGYKLVIGFGDSWRKLADLNPTAILVLYCTEAPAFLTYINEYVAIKNARKDGIKVNPLKTRAYRFYSDQDYARADYIFQMGRENMATVLSAMNIGKDRVKYIASYGIGEDLPYLQRNEKPVNYIWFGSAGSVMKGLYAAAKVFNEVKGPKLLVAGCPKSEFIDLGVESDWVIDVGTIKVPSDKFHDVMETVGFCVFPTGAEGISTALITCMYQGIVPITTKFANIESGYIPLDSASSDEIKRCLLESIDMTKEDYILQSKTSRDFAIKEYTTKKYISSFASALSSIEGV
jgi:hypothetical protein